MLVMQSMYKCWICTACIAKIGIDTFLVYWFKNLNENLHSIQLPNFDVFKNIETRILGVYWNHVFYENICFCTQAC